MSDRYVVRIIDNYGEIKEDYFVKYLSQEGIKKCLNNAIKSVSQKYLNNNNNNTNYELFMALLPVQFMFSLPGRPVEKDHCWAPTILNGFYLVNFQQKKIYYYHINNKIWKSKEWKELETLMELDYYSYSDINSEEYKLYNEANKKFNKMIDDMLKPYINGIYPQYDKCADNEKLIYDFSNIYPKQSDFSKTAKINKKGEIKMNKNIKLAKELIKIAKSLIAFEPEPIQIERKFYIEGKGEKTKLFVKIFSEDWINFGKKPEWLQVALSLNKECQGNYYGVDHSCFKLYKDGSYEIGELTFNGINDEQHKSPEKMIKYNLKRINFVEGKF